MTRERFVQHFQPTHIDRLAACCDLVSREPLATTREIEACCSKVNVVVTGWESPILGSDATRSLPNLRLVAHAAGSLKGIIDPVLLDQGVRVTTAAVANAKPVAEFCLSWILRWNKCLDAFEHDYRAARSSYDFRLRSALDLGNFRRAVGIVSASHVGRELIRLLQTFDIDCLLYDPFVSEDEAEALGARKVDLPTLLVTADIVSLNAPLLPETERMIGLAEFASMKDGALFINTARGRVVDQDAMIEELRDGRISAVLDVTDPEPLSADSPLWAMPNVHITPHIAGSLGGEIRRMSDWCLDEIERFVRGEPLCSEIGPADWARVA